MPQITLTLKVSFDQVPDLEEAAYILKAAIQSRLFGEGLFNDETLVDEWSVSTDKNS